MRVLLPLLLTGCLIGPGQTDDRLDVDEDGFLWPDDCDDSDPAVHEGATEQNDGIDNDCDGAVDEGHDDTGLVIVGAELLPLGTTWSYLDDALPPNGWTSPGFDASSWRSGPAELGYGDGDEATTLFVAAPGQRQLSVAFRADFDVQAPVPTALVIDLICDDGALVTLNGQEIHRTNLPSGTIDANTTAVVDVEDQLVRTLVETTALTEGRNTLAVSVHQSSRQSDDLSFDLGLYRPE